MSITRSVIATSCAFLVASFAISLVQMASHQLHPEIADLFADPIDEAKIAAFEFPLSALLMVALSYAVGSTAGGLVVGRFSAHPRFCAFTVGALFSVANVLNIMMIPHPPWFIALTFILFLPLVVPVALWAVPNSDTRTKND